MKKLERLKAYKSATPTQTINNVRNILYKNDIFVIETSQKQEKTTGVCSCRIILGDEGVRELNIGSNGKGMNARYALASAYAEFMERLQNGALFWKIKGMPTRMPRDISVDKEKFRSCVEKLLRLSYGDNANVDYIARKYTEETSQYTVVSYKEYGTENNILLPVSLINKLTGSNGMAAGNTVLEATLQGLSEIFERQAIQELFLKHITPPRIDEKLFEGSDVLRRLKKLPSKNINYEILDCSIKKELPVIGLLLEKDNKYHVHFGADPSPITALERCLTETFQGREITEIPFYPPLESNSLRTLFENERAEYTDSTGKVPIWLIEGKPSWKFCGFKHWVTLSDEEDMKYYLSIISNLNKKVYIHETGVLGFPTVRVYVPGITENHCPQPEYCLVHAVPPEITKYLRRLPTLNEVEFQELGININSWLKKEYLVNQENDFADEDYFNLRENFPAGSFKGTQWDIRMLIAIIYIKGGLVKQGISLLNCCLEQKRYSEQEKILIRIRIQSNKAAFLLNEWPQCPNCESCRAKNNCYEKQVAEYKAFIEKILKENIGE